MKNLVLAIFVVFFSCSNPRTDQIIVPKLEANFYSSALGRINDELKSTPDNPKLVEQKLYYCQQLDWPTTCVSALDAYKSQHGMTNQLIEQYIFYYSRHHRYQLLVDIIEKWSEEYDLKDKFHQPLIEALVKLGKKDRATLELRNYMIGRSMLGDFEFASSQYLSMGDTLLSTYYLGKLEKLDPTNILMIDYGQLLISLNYSNLGFRVLEMVSPYQLDNRDFNLMLARLYAQYSSFENARNLIKPFSDEDTISYLIADWYMQESKWDSAIQIVNTVIKQDSLNTKAIWRKARIYENRGWLATSLTYFNSILEIQPQDSITSNRINLIQRKIAYLQRKKFEENKIQIREIEPIKINQ
jgi:hypothetical protein